MVFEYQIDRGCSCYLHVSVDRLILIDVLGLVLDVRAITGKKETQ